jgi:hypothetical protein
MNKSSSELRSKYLVLAVLEPIESSSSASAIEEVEIEYAVSKMSTRLVDCGPFGKHQEA